ncbi:MAG: hypothetical protein DMF62_17440 [Acidobacteria bacterium]|nr:MAG: hypothetical protein DMF62_17440 [Acidobacteriota bacterium]
MQMEDSFLRRLIDSLELRSESVAMRIVGDDSQVYTFGESLTAVRSLAYRIGQENIAFGDRIALIGENHPCWALAYLGVLYRGAVCVPLDPHGEIETITNFLENSEAKLAFIGTEFKEKFKVIMEKLGRHITAVVWDHNGLGKNGNAVHDNLQYENEVSGNGFRPFAEWAAAEIPESFLREHPKARGDDTALLIYTSGNDRNAKRRTANTRKHSCRIGRHK